MIYTYTVSGVAYDGDRIPFGESLVAASPLLLHFRTHRYPAASEVTVFCVGSNPAQAVLEPRVFGSWVLWVTVAMATMGAAHLLGLV
nr:hypothetical protein [Rhodoferax sp.]